MSPCTDKYDFFLATFGLYLIDEKEVTTYMTLSMALPLARQRMILVFGWEWLIVGD